MSTLQGRMKPTRSWAKAYTALSVARRRKREYQCELRGATIMAQKVGQMFEKHVVKRIQQIESIPTGELCLSVPRPQWSGHKRSHGGLCEPHLQAASRSG